MSDIINKDEIYQDLIEAFIEYQYRLENPVPKAEETKDFMLMHYRRDAIFNRRVKNIACGVIRILDKHL